MSFPKKPRRESIEVEDDEPAVAINATMPEDSGDPYNLEEQEEALAALIEHRLKEVETNRRKADYYKDKLVEAEKRLNESKTMLARLRLNKASSNKGSPSNGVSKASSNTGSPSNGVRSVKVERRSMSPVPLNSRSQPQSKPELLIPAVTTKVAHPAKFAGSSGKNPVSISAEGSPSAPSQSNSAIRATKDRYRLPSRQEVEVRDKGTKRKFEEKEESEYKEYREIIRLIRTSSKPTIIQCHTNNHICSQHKRKLRCLSLCPVNDQLFATSALDGLVNFWEVQARGSSASRLSTTDCITPKRRWPEDIAWHPYGNSIFSVYSADSGDSQVSVLNLNRTQGNARVTFLDEKPHMKGIINNIVFPPWENICFATGGSDHAVVLWKETDAENVWKPKALHRNIHSSAVMGVAGIVHKQMILSVGADKRIVGFDITRERQEFTHQIESKCMSVLPNPVDFNLYMVQTGAHEKQLRLFDIRLRHTELHAIGWKQESSDSQSALINQAWSPDGYYISSGTADPMIHIFDIRYNAQRPAQSIKAHQKRVFKAIWLRSCPLLVSISSDLNVGLHKIS